MSGAVLNPALPAEPGLNMLLLSAHKEKALLWTATACTVFNIIANPLLIPRFSFVAAAAVTVATECLLLLQNLYLVHKCLGRLVFAKDGLKISAVFAGVLAGFWLTQRAVPQLWADLSPARSLPSLRPLHCPVWAVFGWRAVPRGVE